MGGSPSLQRCLLTAAMRAAAGAVVGTSRAARGALLISVALPEAVVVSARVQWHHLVVASVANTRTFPLWHHLAPRASAPPSIRVPPRGHSTPLIIVPLPLPPLLCRACSSPQLRLVLFY